MFIKTIAILILISIFAISIFTGVTLWSLKKSGMLHLFMKGKTLLSLLTGVFALSFVIHSIGVLNDELWAASGMMQTLVFWLIYIWVYNTPKLLGMWRLVNNGETKSLDQFMGRSKFADGMINHVIAKATANDHEDDYEPHAAFESDLETVIHDDDAFTNAFDSHISKKLKRKFIGLLLHTVLVIGAILLC